MGDYGRESHPILSGNYLHRRDCISRKDKSLKRLKHGQTDNRDNFRKLLFENFNTFMPFEIACHAIMVCSEIPDAIALIRRLAPLDAVLWIG
jgi:hypothetical protein